MKRGIAETHVFVVLSNLVWLFVQAQHRLEKIFAMVFRSLPVVYTTM